MRRHYLAGSADLECLAAETLMLGRSFATPPPAIAKLDRLRSPLDRPASVSFLEPRRPSARFPIADTKEDAANAVDENLQSTYSQIHDPVERPKWKIDPVIEDEDGLYFVVRVIYLESPTVALYLVPRPTLLSAANLPLYSWLKLEYGQPANVWPASPPPVIQPASNLEVVLGDDARSDHDSFSKACDLFASFMSHVIMDRDVEESSDRLTWSGTLADVRICRPRFLEPGGGGSYSYGGGGWDFSRLTMICNRSNGAVSLAVEPIIYPIKQLPTDVLAPPWTIDELKLMGWKPLTSPNIFGDRLLPREYCEVADEFNPAADRPAMAKTQSKLRRTWGQDRSLPPPNLMYAILYDRAGDRESAQKWIRNFGREVAQDPAALADVARWELSVGEIESARQHADAALELHPDYPAAKKVIDQLATSEVKHD